MSQWRADPEPTPPSTLTTILAVIPVGIVAAVIVFSLLAALYGVWQVSIVGALVGVPQWWALNRFLRRGGSWTRIQRRAFIVALYVATAAALVVGFLLAAVPVAVTPSD